MRGDIAMESTGVYWKPVWNILEGQFTLVLATRHASRIFQFNRRLRHVLAKPGKTIIFDDILHFFDEVAL